MLSKPPILRTPPALVVLALLANPACPAVAADSDWHAEPTTNIESQAVTFSNGDAKLSGTLFIPRLPHAVPAVVVYHGASEPLANTPLYRHLSEGLPQIGMAVLLFDRRGTGASTGKANVPYQVLSDDGVAGANAIRQVPAIDAARVGYWGISQGGWLSTLAAAHDPRAAFAVAVSAPLVSPELQMKFAMSNRLRVMGYGQADVDDMLAARQKLDGYFNGVNSRADAVAALENIENRPWFGQMYLPKAASVPTDPAKSSWKGEMDVDSFAAVAQVRIPIIYILGAEDPWIPVSQSVARLRQLTPTHPLLQFAVIPQANHLMMESVRETMNDAGPEQVAVEVPQSPAYFMLLAAWLQATKVAPLASAR